MTEQHLREENLYDKPKRYSTDKAQESLRVEWSGGGAHLTPRWLMVYTVGSLMVYLNGIAGQHNHNSPPLPDMAS